MKEYTSWVDFWRSFESDDESSIMKDSYFFTDLQMEEDDQLFYDESISKRVSTNKGVKSGIKGSIRIDAGNKKIFFQFVLTGNDYLPIRLEIHCKNA